MSSKTVEQVLQGVFSGKYEALTSPEEPVELGESILGTLKSEQAMALYCVTKKMGKTSQVILEDLLRRKQLGEFKDKASQKKMVQTVLLHKNRYDVMMNLFWEMCYEEFPQARDPEVDIAIRKDWQVVVFKKATFLDIFGQIFGG